MSSLPTLPPIRTDIAAAKADLDEFGLTRFQGALTDSEVRQVRTRLLEQAAGEAAQGIAFNDSGAPEIGYFDGPNQRVFNLINKGQIFRDVVMKPVVRELINHVLGEELLLSAMNSNLANPGGVAMPLHRDDAFAPQTIPFPIVANAMWMLDDFTEENGGTRVVPGSHRDNSFSFAAPPTETVAVTGPAGTVVAFDGRLWHGTGANRSNAGRAAVFTYYCLPFMRQQENFTTSLAPEVIAQCSPELLALLGFQNWRSLGGINGSRPGEIHRRPSTFVTELRA